MQSDAAHRKLVNQSNEKRNLGDHRLHEVAESQAGEHHSQSYQHLGHWVPKGPDRLHREVQVHELEGCQEAVASETQVDRTRNVAQCSPEVAGREAQEEKEVRQEGSDQQLKHRVPLPIQLRYEDRAKHCQESKGHLVRSRSFLRGVVLVKRLFMFALRRYKS